MAKKQNQAKVDNSSASNEVNMLTNFERRITLTSEQIDQMTMPEVGKALEEASKPKPKNKKVAETAAKPEEKPTFQIFFDQNMPETFDASVRLSSLYPLDATGIPGAESAMRGITHSWVEHLELQLEINNWPDSDWHFKDPVYAVASNHGPVPFDGNHRWEAYVLRLAKVLKVDLKDKDWRKNAALTARVHETFIPVRVTNRINNSPVTDGDLLTMAFTANFMHGMVASTYGRTAYAMHLLEVAAERGTPIKQDDAARAAGVTKFALSMAIGRLKDRLEKKAKQPAEVSFLDREANEAIDELRETRDIETADQQLNNAVKAFINASSTLMDLLGDDASELATLLEDKLTGKKREEQVDALIFAAEAIGIVSENDIAEAEARQAKNAADAEKRSGSQPADEAKIPTGPLQ